MSLQSGQPYTFSAYIKTTDITSFGTGGGVCLKVTTASGAVHRTETLGYATSEAVDNGWTRLSLSFTPTATGNATLQLYASGVTGSLYADDFQLEAAEAPSKTVYNFQVEDFHTYYGTDIGVWVHNSCKHQTYEWRKIKSDYWKSQAAQGGNDT